MDKTTMSSYLQDIEKDSFDAANFVERLAWRVTGGVQDGLEFDPMSLHSAFVQALTELQALHEIQKKKCERLESLCREDEKRYRQKVVDLLERNKMAFGKFQELDNRINSVATKVVHLGDQLESVNALRSRAVEAQKLMNYFDDFLLPEPFISDVFTSRSQLYEAADIIQKLHQIAQELTNEKFMGAKQKIESKYSEIEESLLEEFIKAHGSNDTTKMKEIAGILSHFNNPQCVEAFIEHSQLGAFLGPNIFKDILALCKANFEVINKVFANPEQVKSKFVKNVYHGRLQQNIDGTLSAYSSPEAGQYLRDLFNLYSKTMQLSESLSSYNVANDGTFFTKLTNVLFQKYLATYMSVEIGYLKEKSNSILRAYYESKKHQKRPVGSFQGLRQNIQNVIGSRGNVGTVQGEADASEVLISVDVAVNLLEEHNQALRRCQLLSKPSLVPSNAVEIFDLLVHYLVIEHMDYAVELALQTMPSPGSRGRVPFFDLVHQCNTIVHLIETQFNNSLFPLIHSTPKLGVCLQKKKNFQQQMEAKLDMGLQRTVQGIIGWIKQQLQMEQKKSEFRRDTPKKADSGSEAPTSPRSEGESKACKVVTNFLRGQIEQIKESLDGKNLELVMMELGTSCHRSVYEHMLQFQYGDVGAMLLICDVNEYRKCLQDMGVPLVNNLFDMLLALCNLLVVQPENVMDVCTDERLAVLDKAIVQSFIQLRLDHRTPEGAAYSKLLPS